MSKAASEKLPYLSENNDWNYCIVHLGDNEDRRWRTLSKVWKERTLNPKSHTHENIPQEWRQTFLRWRKLQRTAKGSSSDWEIITGGKLETSRTKEELQKCLVSGSAWFRLPTSICHLHKPSHSSRYSCMCCVSPRSANALWLFLYSPTVAPKVSCVYREMVQRLWRHNIWIQSLKPPLTNWELWDNYLTSLCFSVLIFKMGG